MQRHNFRHDGLNLSYLDAGGTGETLIALHAHWMEGQTFAALASALAPGWRVIAPDQRGHGHSDHASTYTREDYLGDLAALVAHLGISRAVFLGNSLGGVNAYQFAARRPDCVRALIVEDIGTVIGDDTSFALAWSGVFKSCQDLEDRVGARFFPCLKDSVRSVAGGWRFAFEPKDMVQSQTHLNGDHWADWLASTCPALLLRGESSRVTTQQHVEEMAARRPATRLRVLPGGHVVHFDNPSVFNTAVAEFLAQLPA
jgi:pimeloyl-ACP methyl ester carboxylesterase